jgi:hypothetical protein
MEFIHYLLFALLSAMGPIFGFVVSLYTKDEIEKGRGLIELVQKLSLLFIAIVLLFTRINSFAEIVILLAIIVFHFIRSGFIFFTFGVLFFLFSFAAVPGMYLLIFAYFLLYGALTKPLRIVILQSMVFLATALVVYGAWWLLG